MTDMCLAQGQVLAFHRQVVGVEPGPMPTIKPDFMTDTALAVATQSQDMLEEFKANGDQRFLRAHLVLEEAAELCVAMANGDEVETLDALADLLYVTLGTAAQFDLPLNTAFDEVHRSNMTKRRQRTDADGVRVRDKGPDYSPPDIAGVLTRYRQRKRPGEHYIVYYPPGRHDEAKELLDEIEGEGIDYANVAVANHPGFRIERR